MEQVFKDLPHHKRIDNAVFRRAVDLMDAGDVPGLREYLHQHPAVVRQRVNFPGGKYFLNPSLLEFAAENPVRRGHLPAEIVAAMKVILDAGAAKDLAILNETLALVCSGRVAREYGVQVGMIQLLCEYGANGDYAMPPALAHGEFEAVDALLSRGARANIEVSAALGKAEQVRELLAEADGEARHRALALAAQFGHASVAGLLLDAGEDPNRFNPEGFHSHSTPLHQAALGGHAAVWRLLIERGASADIRDKMWGGTAADWARHAGRPAIVTDP